MGKVVESRVGVSVYVEAESGLLRIRGLWEKKGERKAGKAAGGRVFMSERGARWITE